MKQIVILLLSSIPVMSFAQTEYHCFKNDKNPKMQIQMKLVGGTGVAIKYKGQKQNFSITQDEIGEYNLEDNRGNIIGSSISYEEVYKGKVVGEYTYYDFKNKTDLLIYKSYSKNKEYKFIFYKRSKQQCF